MACETNSHEYPRNKEVYEQLSLLKFDVTWKEVPQISPDSKVRPIARFPNWRICNTHLEKAVAIADCMSEDKYQE